MKTGFHLQIAGWIACIVLVCGCSRPQQSSSSSTAKTRQASAMADKAEELEFVDENGKTDWRGRVDAAKEALGQAKSDYRWGSKQSALEKALDAARLLPPSGKDFALAELTGESTKGATDAENDSQQGTGEDEMVTEPSGSSVTNEEVAELRDSLDKLFASLDGSVGQARGNMSLERTLIEIE